MEASAFPSGLPAGARFGVLRRVASDERLVEAVRAGRAVAFETIFDRYQRQILSFCRHMLGSREEAEDAVQNTFAAAYTDLLRSDKAIQLRPWLYAIARNQCLSILRTRRDHSSIEDVEPAVEGLAPAVQRREDLRAILRDLSQLPDDQRAALLLSELGALSHGEIADVVGCEKGKVKALVFQARSSLAADREARETSCQQIREQLSTLSGGALRRAHLRRHLSGCAGCRDFQAEVKLQRGAMAVLLPVAPTAALKSGVMSSVAAKAGASGGAGLAASGGAGLVASGAGGGLGATLANLGVMKLVVAGAVVVGTVGGGTVAAVHEIDAGSGSPAAVSHHSRSGSGSAATPSGVAPARAHGEQALGKQTGGVANGQSIKGDLGRSGTAPGQTGSAPGLAGTSPGQAGTTPGKSGTAPGKSKPSKEGSNGHARKSPKHSTHGNGQGRSHSPSGGGGGRKGSGGGSQGNGQGKGQSKPNPGKAPEKENAGGNSGNVAPTAPSVPSVPDISEGDGKGKGKGQDKK